MENSFDMLSETERSVYESLPVPLAVLYAESGHFRLLAASDGAITLIGWTRELTRQHADDPLQLVWEDDRDMVRTQCEYALMYPGDESRTTPRMKTASAAVKVCCRARARHLKNVSYLLFLTFSDASEDPCRAPDRQDGSLSAGYEVIARWHADLTSNVTLEYHPYSARALSIRPEAPYDEMAALAGRSPRSPEDQEKLTALLDREALLRRFRESGPQHAALEYRRDEDGQMPFWAAADLSVFSAPDGRVECIVTVYDITVKLLESQLVSRLTALGYDVVGLLSIESGKCRFFRLKKLKLGMRFEQYMDYQESIEEDIDRIIAPEQREAVRQGFRLETITAHLQEESLYSYSYTMTTSDGRRLQKLLQFSYLDERRDTLFFCKSDITRQTLAEQAQIEQLHAAKLEADRANAAKSSFLSSMSHDLRTPLNGIVGFTDLALRESDPVKKQDYLSKIQSSGALLLDLVNDTLELSRIESGKIVLEPEAVEIRAMTDAVVTSLRPSAELKRLRLEADAGDFPAVVVWTDRLKFQKVFLNLLSNAIKYTPAGGTVRASVVPLVPPVEGRNYRLTVSDTGIGISPEFLPRIFDAFSQERRPESANILGTGLGLTIVRRIVDLMGGTVSAVSAPGAGSIFTVDLPLRPAADLPAAEQDETAEPVSLSGRRILLCEDNYLNTEIARILLQERGMQVVCTPDGQAGAERFRASAPGYFDAILMDIRMPVMDGYEATRLIRSLERPDAASIPIIAMTADAFEEDIRNCAEAGMNGHVIKPINPARLMRALENALAPAAQ